MSFLLLATGIAPAIADPLRATPSPAGLHVSVSTSNSTGSAPLKVGFAGKATGGSGGYRFQWSFGDGSSGVGARYSHIYRSAGNFTANLTVTDSNGTSARVGTAVLVGPKLLGIPGVLGLGPRLAVTPASFWSVDAQTSCASCISTNQSVTRFLAETPFSWVRYGQASDRCNISRDRSYSDSGAASHGCHYSISALKSWCYAQIPHCRSILTLPGENNDSGEDAAIAQWIVSTQGFQPTYWAIGNEPTGWTHYGIPWAGWNLSDNSTPTALAYAYDVKAAIAAVKAVDPAARFIGIEAACSCQKEWFQDLATVDGGQISALAVHSYPSSGLTNETLAQFFAPLLGSRNLSGTFAAVHAAVQGLCPTCDSLPVLVNEYNAGPGWGPSRLGGSYANAAFLAASVVEGLRSNITQLTIFNLQNPWGSLWGYSLLNRTGVPGPNGLLFSRFLSHLAIGSVYSAPIAGAPGDIWSVVTANATHESLLVVNTNLSRSLALALGQAFPTAVLGTIYQWDAALRQPRVTFGQVATGYSIPSEGMLLITVPLPAGVHLAPRSGAADTPAPPPRAAAHALVLPGGETSFGPGGLARWDVPSAASATGRRQGP